MTENDEDSAARETKPCFPIYGDTPPLTHGARFREAQSGSEQCRERLPPFGGGGVDANPMNYEAIYK